MGHRETDQAQKVLGVKFEVEVLEQYHAHRRIGTTRKSRGKSAASNHVRRWQQLSVLLSSWMRVNKKDKEGQHEVKHTRRYAEFVSIIRNMERADVTAVGSDA